MVIIFAVLIQLVYSNLLRKLLLKAYDNTAINRGFIVVEHMEYLIDFM